MWLEDVGTNIFTTDAEREIVRRAEAKKTRFQQLKEERAKIVTFFSYISGDPKSKQEALRRQLAENTKKFHDEFAIKERHDALH